MRTRHNAALYVHCPYTRMFKTSIHLDYISLTKSLLEVFGTGSFKKLRQFVKRIDLCCLESQTEFIVGS
jgi:hypothetical protein